MLSRFYLCRGMDFSEHQPDWDSLLWTLLWAEHLLQKLTMLSKAPVHNSGTDLISVMLLFTSVLTCSYVTYLLAWVLL